ncbi:MAG: penicillin-binding protein 2 [Dongiaceae bacterium]
MLVNQEKVRARLFTRRAALLAGVKVVLLGALAGRMYQLQVVQSGRFTALAEDNAISPKVLEPYRGRVFDRFGIPLAENDHNYRVVVVPEQTESLSDTLAQLARYIPLTDADRNRILEESKRKPSFMPIEISENLNWPEVTGIEVNSPDLPGVDIEVGQKRRYPQAHALAHVLGYVAAVAESDLNGDRLLKLPGFRIGKNGIEKQYEEKLRGHAGIMKVEVNALGRVSRELRDQDYKEPTAGEDMVVSIDAGLQSYIQQRLTSELSGSAVVLDVHNGDVLGLGSTPSFDPSMFTRGLTTKEWQSLVSDPLRPLANKAIAGQYAPGSTFKMITALAALAIGTSPSYRVFCPGVYRVGNAQFHCWKKGGHGHLDMYDGLKNSCDVFFYDTARRAGIDNIAKMAHLFGFGQPTGIDLPGEQPGLIPDQNWKQATFGEPWYPGETPSAGIGQGFITSTPLQLAVMTARLCNGGRAVVPRLARNGIVTAGAPVTAEPAPSLGVPEAHLAVIHEGMKRVTNQQGGTGYRIRIDVPGMEMAGKTGTAQVRRITMRERLAGVRKNEDLPWGQRDHALFVGFAPVAAPQYAVAVVVEHGGGGSKVAGPIARDILLETQRRDPARVNVNDRLALAEKS